MAAGAEGLCAVALPQPMALGAKGGQAVMRAGLRSEAKTAEQPSI
jgi:hypothetical protein